MAIKSSGPLKFQDIVDEFGGNQPHALSEYARGAGLVPNSNLNSQIGASGEPIAMSQFYGATRVITMTWTGVGGGGAGGNGIANQTGSGNNNPGKRTGIMPKGNFDAFGSQPGDAAYTGGANGRAEPGSGGAHANNGKITGDPGAASEYGNGGAGGASNAAGGRPAWGNWGAGGGGGGGDDGASDYFIWGGGDAAGAGGAGGGASATASKAVALDVDITYVVVVGGGGNPSSYANYLGGRGAPGYLEFTLSNEDDTVTRYAYAAGKQTNPSPTNAEYTSDTPWYLRIAKSGQVWWSLNAPPANWPDADIIVDTQGPIRASDYLTGPGTLSVAAGVYVWSDDTANAAVILDVDGTVLENRGFIMGKGGQGGTGTAGLPGGPAIEITADNCIVKNVDSAAYIAGGGGGGGGNGGGGAGGGRGGGHSTYGGSATSTPGAGGAIGEVGGNGSGVGGNGGGSGGAGGDGYDTGSSNFGAYAGGGGGRILPGVGGTAGTSAGGFGSRGAGGAGGSAQNPGQNGISGAGSGGGGGWGAVGGARSGLAGGAGGRSIKRTSGSYSLDVTGFNNNVFGFRDSNILANNINSTWRFFATNTTTTGPYCRFGFQLRSDGTTDKIIQNLSNIGGSNVPGLSSVVDWLEDDIGSGNGADFEVRLNYSNVALINMPVNSPQTPTLATGTVGVIQNELWNTWIPLSQHVAVTWGNPDASNPNVQGIPITGIGALCDVSIEIRRIGNPDTIDVNQTVSLNVNTEGTN